MKKIDLNNKTILVTGSAGFIGSYLVERLCKEYKVKVIGIDNLNDYYDIKLKEYRLNKLLTFENFKFIKGDIADKELIQGIFEEYKPNIVVNLAAQAGVRYSIENPDIYINTNVIGFYNILEAIRNNPVEHFVYASSSSIYGDEITPYLEKTNTDKPVSLYGATKKCDEVLAYSYSKMYNIPSTGLRFFTVYGPLGRPDMAYFDFTNKLINREKIKIYNYGNCKRDFTYIDDIVEGIIRVIQASPDTEISHNIYNVGNSKPINMIDFISILEEEIVNAELLPKDYDFTSLHELIPMQKGDVIETYSDTTKLEKDYGFRPNTSIREGLRKFIEWYKEYYIKR